MYSTLYVLKYYRNFILNQQLKLPNIILQFALIILILNTNFNLKINMDDDSKIPKIVFKKLLMNFLEQTTLF